MRSKPLVPEPSRAGGRYNAAALQRNALAALDLHAQLQALEAI
jgi:hypothetical protein